MPTKFSNRLFEILHTDFKRFLYIKVVDVNHTLRNVY
jgi:hypothetical protein